MKKLTIAFALIVGFAFVGVDHVSASCGNPSLNRPFSETVSTSTDPITSDIIYATTTVEAINNQSCDGGSPEMVATQWGRNSDHKRYAPGVSFINSVGVADSCPSWFPLAGCVDITNTVLWRSLYWNK